MPKPLDITNQKFNKLTAIKPLSERTLLRRIQWLCKCDCGNTKQYSHSSLMSGRVKSCGCLNKELQQKFKDNLVTHGLSSNPCYRVWVDMIKRCTNENSNNYYNYGGRGITVCNEWLNSFENFYKDMGERPNGKTLDRKDVNGNYEPSNCRWATFKEQSNNRRNTLLVTYNNITKSLKHWCRDLNINYNTVWDRINRGIPVLRALNLE